VTEVILAMLRGTNVGPFEVDASSGAFFADGGQQIHDGTCDNVDSHFLNADSSIPETIIFLGTSDLMDVKLETASRI
jgi:hypothetical protein